MCLQPRRPKWGYGKARWKLFRQRMDEELQRSEHAALATRAAAFADALRAAARAAIPRGAGRRAPKSWWWEEAEAAVAKRRAARKQAASGKRKDLNAWNRANREARYIITECKRRDFHEFATTLNAHTQDGKVHATVRAMDPRL